MPFDIKAGVSWVKAHPWEAGGLVFVVGVGAFILLGGGKGGGSSGGGDANLASYLSAETAQNAQDNATQLGLAQVAASTTQAGITAQNNVDLANIFAGEQTASETSQQNLSLISYFGQLANNLGTILTSSKSSSSGSGGGLNLGFGGFGFGFNSNSNNASSSSQQTLVANSEQGAAEQELEAIANSNFHIGN